MFAAELEDSGLEEVPIESAKHLGPSVYGCMDDGIVLGVLEHHRLPDDRIDDLRDADQCVDVLLDFSRIEGVKSLQSGVISEREPPCR